MAQDAGLPVAMQHAVQYANRAATAAWDLRGGLPMGAGGFTMV